MPRSGRTTRMLERALKLARDYETIPIMVPTQRHGEHLTRMAERLIYHYPADGEQRLARLKFITPSQARYGGLHGLTYCPLLADHTFYESIEWLHDVLARITPEERLDDGH